MIPAWTLIPTFIVGVTVGVLAFAALVASSRKR